MFLIKEILVDVVESPIRIEGFARAVFKNELPSNKSIKKAVKNGIIRVNNEVITSAYWVTVGNRIQLWEMEKNAPKPFDIDLEVVFEDDHFAIIIKPAGISVSGNQFRTVQNGIINLLQKSNEADALSWPRPVHRLDKATSGLLVIGKTISGIKDLGLQFETRSLKKTYHAIVMGETPKLGTMHFDIDGQTAITKYVKLGETSSLQNRVLTLLKLSPETGRTHQIRIHCAQLGWPILGDQLYSARTKKNKGLFLTASGLEFKHPKTHEIVKLSIPLPHKFKTHLDREQRRWDKYNANKQ